MSISENYLLYKLADAIYKIGLINPMFCKHKKDNNGNILMSEEQLSKVRTSAIKIQRLIQDKATKEQLSNEIEKLCSIVECRG